MSVLSSEAVITLSNCILFEGQGSINKPLKRYLGMWKHVS